MDTSTSIQQELSTLRADYMKVYSSFEEKTLPDGTKARDIPANRLEELTKMNADMDAKQKMLDDMKAVARAGETIADAEKRDRQSVTFSKERESSSSEKPKDWYDLAVKAAGDMPFKDALKHNGGIEFDGVKTLMSTSAGYAPQITRTGEIIPYASKPPQVIDYLRILPTDQNAVTFMEQTTRTSGAAAKAEATALAESTEAFTLRTFTCQRIGTFLNVTEEQMEDAPEVKAFLNYDLPLMVRQELDRNVTVGSGTSPEPLGIYNGSAVQTQARGSDPAFDAILKAIVKVGNTAGTSWSQADVVAMHSTDWQFLALTRTADGLYILGNPNDMAVRRVWGLPIVLCNALTATNALVFDSNFFTVRMRKPIQVDLFDQHGENAINNILMLRAYCRATLQIKRSGAACRVTGLPTS